MSLNISDSLLSRLSDHELVASFRDSNCSEREALVWNLEHIAELDRRKLFYGFSSLWDYLVHEHGLEESTAERKIRAARLMNRFPGLKAKLESGKLNLSLLEIAQGCASREKLSDVEQWELLEAISGMSCKRARLEVVKRFPNSVEIPHDLVRPFSEKLSEVRFIAPNELLELLDEIRGLLAHSHPQMKLADLIEVLAREYYSRHHPEEKAKRAEARAQKREEQAERSDAGNLSKSVDLPSLPKVVAEFEDGERRIASDPQKHALTSRDGYGCSYVDPLTHQRCDSRFALEVDHRIAWSHGGKTVLANLRFLCRNHHRRVSFLQANHFTSVGSSEGAGVFQSFPEPPSLRLSST